MTQLLGDLRRGRVLPTMDDRLRLDVFKLNGKVPDCAGVLVGFAGMCRNVATDSMHMCFLQERYCIQLCAPVT